MYETLRDVEFEVGEYHYRTTDCEVYARDGCLEVRKLGTVHIYSESMGWIRSAQAVSPDRFEKLKFADAIHAALIDDVAAIEQECAEIELAPSREYNSEEKDMS